MEEGSRLQEVTLKLLSQVEAVLDEGSAGLSELNRWQRFSRTCGTFRRRLSRCLPVVDFG